MTVNSNDMERLCAEILESTSDKEGVEWSDGEGIELEAILTLRDIAFDGIIERAMPGEDMNLLIKNCIATTFMMGWEAHKQFGQPGTII